MDSFNLEGKSVLVTGASSGIGLEIARALAKAGAKVFITGRNLERLAAALESLSGEGHACFPADFLVEDQLKSLVDAVPALDGVVLNAGIIPKLIPFQMADGRQMREVMDVNFTAPADLLNLLLKKKKIANRASIVAITSIGSFLGPKASAAYSASKAALTALIRSVAIDVAKREIRANCVSLGYVKTDAATTTVSEDMLNLVPLGAAEASEITGPVLFLLSEASRWITRTTIIVDGGISLKLSHGM